MHVSMYADDSTLCQQSQLVKSLQTYTKSRMSVLLWVASDKLVLNISKTKSIVFSTNNSLSFRPQLNLIMNSVAVKQVEETKLLGVTLDCTRSKHLVCFVDTSLHKASPAGSSFILSGLLSSHVVSWPRTERHGLLFIVIRGLISILCSQSLLAKSRGDWTASLLVFRRNSIENSTLFS
jgi:hypothetical protein